MADPTPRSVEPAGDDSRELLLPVDGGEVAVVDHGGSGPGIVLVHSLGYNAAAWEALVPHLTPRARVVALDLRGHGHSTARMHRADDLSRDLPRVVEQLGLDAPLVVGHDASHYQVTVAALREPGFAGGLCLLAGLSTRDEAALADLIEETASPALGRQLRDRFLLGAAGYGQEARAALIAEVCRRGERDWLTSELGPRLMRRVAERATPMAQDGSWLLCPTLGTLYRGYAVDLDPACYPSRDLFGRLRVPTLVVHPRDGLDADVTSEIRAIVEASEHLTYASIRSGQWPQATCPERLARLLLDFASRVR